VLDGVGEHAHAPVELEHVDKLESGEEDDQCHHEAVRLVPDADRHEIDVLACRSKQASILFTIQNTH